MGILFDGNVNFNNTNNNSLKTSDLKIGQIDPELSQIGKMLGKQQKDIQLSPELEESLIKNGFKLPELNLTPEQKAAIEERFENEKQQKNIQINPELKGMPHASDDIPEVVIEKMPEPKVEIPRGFDVDPVKMPKSEIEIPEIDKPNNKTLL